VVPPPDKRRRLRGGPRGTGKSERLAGDYNILNNIVNHLSHTISKCLSDIAQQDWSNKAEDEKLLYMDGLARVLFDDKSVATLCVYDLQDAWTNLWI